MGDNAKVVVEDVDRLDNEFNTEFLDEREAA